MALQLGGLAKIPPKQKTLLAILASILIAAGYYTYFYRASAAQVAQLRTRLAEMESKIKEQEVIARNLPSFQAEVHKLEEQLALLLDQLPNTAEIPNLLRNVSNLGREAGLEFVKFSPRPEVAKEFFAEIPVSIQVTGNFHNFLSFADRVGRLPRIVNLSDIVFTPAKGSGNRSDVGVACTATTYRFIDQAATPAAAKGGGK